ncbi:MAG: hypothetical protein ACTSSH_09050 [Candidatus Heimdallarchaeota archaeon]
MSADTKPTFYAITQSTTTVLVESIKGVSDVSSVDFYNFWGDSGHTPYMGDKLSNIYLYEDADTGEISLIMHHSEDFSSLDQMRVDFNFDFIPEGIPEGVYVALSDDDSHIWDGGHPDGNEFDLTQEPEGSWEFYHNSDGGVLAGLPTDTPWTIKITPSNIEGITEWQYQETDSTTISLNMQEPLIVSSDLSNVSPDPGVDLGFKGLSGGGSIDVTKLLFFGCGTSQFPTPFFNIQVTVEFGTANICMAYDDSKLGKVKEKNLKLWATEKIIQGDVNFDGRVNGKDITAITEAIQIFDLGDWPTYWDQNINNNGEGNGWNPYCDVDCDGDVDLVDLGYAETNFGQKSPWINITTSIDTESNMLYGETDHFSIFRGR